MKNQGLTTSLTILLCLSVAIPAFGQGKNWKISGNSNIGPGKFLGTTNRKPIRFRTNNKEWMRLTPKGILRLGHTGLPKDAHLKFVNGNSTNGGFVLGLNGGQGGPGIIRLRESVPMLFYTDDLERMRITESGEVGIGTMAPNATLDVVGSFRLDDGTQQPGYVLTSDGSGNASWQPAPAPNAVVDLDVTGRLKVGASSIVIEQLSPGVGNHIYTTAGSSDMFINSTDGTQSSPQETTAHTILNANQNTGNVGIGTNTPETKLHVAGAATVGTRNSIFAVGANSFGQGSMVRAVATNSHAEGQGTYAGANAAHAEGVNTLATGIGAHSEGYNGTASGDYSHSEGYQSSTQGLASHSEGYRTFTTARGAHAEGERTRAQAVAAHAQGISTWSDGIGSHTGGIGLTPAPWVRATKRASFNHSEVTTTYTGSGADADNSVILGGVDNEVQSSAPRSVVLGGSGISATDADKVYMPNAEIIGTTQTDQLKVVNGATANWILADDGNGNGDVVWADPASLFSGSNWSLTGNAGTTAGTNFLGTTDNQDLVFKTNNTEHIRLSSTGELGVGTTNPMPGSKIHMDDPVVGNVNDVYLVATNSGSTAGGPYNAGFKFGIGANGVGLIKIEEPLRPIHFYTGGSTHMALHDNGHLGIGSSEADHQLHLYNTTGGGVDVYTQFTNRNTQVSTPQPTDGLLVGIEADAEARINQQEAKDLVVYTANAERMRVIGETGSNQGYVGIATASPVTELHVDGSITIGNRNASAIGTNSFAQGNFVIATADYAHAEGQVTQATGLYSHAEGTGSRAANEAAHAEGSNTIASGRYAHAEGGNTSATTDAAHAEGFGTQVSANYGHAEGYYTSAEGPGASHAGGMGSPVKRLQAGGRAAFNHSEVDAFYTGVGASADNSAILGGMNNSIIGGATGAVVLGGNGLIGSTSNTVYTPDLEVRSNTPSASGLRLTELTNAFVPSVTGTKFLTVDAMGNVVLENAGAADDQQVDNFSFASGILTLEIEDDGQAPHTVNLSGLADNWGTQVVQTDATLTGDGTSANPLDVGDWSDADDLDASGNVIALQGNPVTSTAPAGTNTILKWDGSKWALATDEIEDADDDPNNEIQDLQLSGTNILSLTNDPTTVDLTTYLDNTDNQDLTLAGTLLSLTNDPTPVDLAGTFQQVIPGTNGQTLRYNTTGWEAVDNLYNDISSGFIGINHNTPDNILHVGATNEASALRVHETTGNIGIGIAPSTLYRMQMDVDNAGGTRGLLMRYGSATPSGNEIIATQRSGVNVFKAGADGRVGIGTGNNSANHLVLIDNKTNAGGFTGQGGLHVIGGNSATQDVVLFQNNQSTPENLAQFKGNGDVILANAGAGGGQGNVGLGLGSPQEKLSIANGFAQWTGPLTGTTVNDGFKIGLFGPDVLLLNAEGGAYRFNSGDVGGGGGLVQRMLIEGNGNVAIGNIVPDAKLDVDGKTQTTDFQMTSGTGPGTTGYVLTAADNEGNAMWADASTINDDDWQKSGANLVTIPTGRVLPASTKTQDLGSNSAIWKSVYLDDAVRMGNSGAPFLTRGGGSFNTLVGFTGNTVLTGVDNTFVGADAGKSTNSGWRNTFIGRDAGRANTSASYNVFVGWNSGSQNVTGDDNVFIGRSAGSQHQSGNSNIFIGSQTAYRNSTGAHNTIIGTSAGGTTATSTASHNTCIGMQAGQDITTGQYNTLVGKNAGMDNTTGQFNVALGYLAGSQNSTGSDNTFIGTAAGQNNVASQNTYIGTNAGKNSNDPLATKNVYVGYGTGSGATGYENTMVGFGAGNNTSGRKNVFMGTGAGDGNSTGRSNTYVGYNAKGSADLINAAAIGNDAFVDADNTMVLGDLVSRVAIGATNAGGYTFYVNGTTYTPGGVWTASDQRYKRDIKKIESPLEKLMKLEGKTYHYQETEEINFPKRQALGVLAQDLEQVFPELVRTGDDGYKAVNYDGLIPVIIEAMKTQQTTITDQNQQLKDQAAEIDALKQLIADNNTGLDINTLEIWLTGEGQTIVLNQNEPNPFREQTTITYFIPETVQQAEIVIHDVSGKVVHRERLVHGKGIIYVYGSDINTGTYTYSIVADGKVSVTRKMILGK